MEGGDQMDEKRNKREECPADERDWTQLPSDLLHIIYEKLPDFLDCIYFRATCKAWNLPVPLPDATPRHPWLFDPYNSYDSAIRFYAFTSNVTISVPTSEANRTIRRSVYRSTPYIGCMLYYQDETASYSCSLINPLTGTSYADFKVEGCDGVPVPSHVPRLLRARDGYVFSEISTSPCLLAPHERLLTLYRIRNNEQQASVLWKLNGTQAAYEFYKEKYFIHSSSPEKTIVLDASNKILDLVTLPAVEAPMLPENGERLFRRFNYLIESSGELLLIFALTYIRRPMLHRYVFVVHRLDDEDGYLLEDGDGYCQWDKMRGIGDRAIFLNECDGFSCRSSDYPRLKKNSIYFMRSTTKRVIGDDADDNPFNNNHTVIVASRYDLETGLVEDFPYIMNYWGSWYLPSLHQ